MLSKEIANLILKVQKVREESQDYDNALSDAIAKVCEGDEALRPFIEILMYDGSVHVDMSYEDVLAWSNHNKGE